MWPANHADRREKIGKGNTICVNRVIRGQSGWCLVQTPYNIDVHSPAAAEAVRRRATAENVFRVKWHSALTEPLQRAKGAAFHISLGQRPRTCEIKNAQR